MKEKYLEEIEHSYTMTTVMEEAQRCLLCLDAPCSAMCPAHTNPGDFIRSVRFRNFKGAAETIVENNALGAICARVCPTERYCELGCTRSGIDVPINIGGIQKFVMEFEREANMSILEKGEDNGMSIGIVGSGPAGIQAAATLLQFGYSVEIYEQDAEAGGYLRYGIPEYRLPNDIVDYEIERIKNLGATITCDVKIGRDISLNELKEKHDSVLIAIGASEGKTLDMFKDNNYVETAVDFLARVKENKGDVALPKNALVIGGGDVAMDVVTTLKILGVETVTDVVYESFSEFRASKKELEAAQNVGVTIMDGYKPLAVEDNIVTFEHRHIESRLTLKADKIYLAVGQDVDASDLGLDIVNNEVVFDGYRTEDSKVYVAGDIAHGDKTVVWAVQKGKESAQLIHENLGGSQ